MRKISVILLTLLLLVASCSAPKRASTQEWHGDGAKRVLFVGDSITVLTASQLENTAQVNGYSTHVEATVGITIEQSLNSVQKYVPDMPDVVVINLGTNDANQNLPLPISEYHYYRMISYFPKDTCLVVTTLSERINPLFTVEINKVMRDEQNLREILDRKNFNTADWANEVAQHPEYIPDGIHPANQGLDEYAKFMVNNVNRC